MRKVFLATAFALGLAACANVSTPNPACDKVAGIVQNAERGLTVARTAFSIAETFGVVKVGSTVEKIIYVALNSAQAALTDADKSLAAGNCDVTAYVNAAVAAVKTATDALAQAGSVPATGGAGLAHLDTPHDVVDLAREAQAIMDASRL